MLGETDVVTKNVFLKILHTVIITPYLEPMKPSCPSRGFLPYGEADVGLGNGRPERAARRVLGRRVKEEVAFAQGRSLGASQVFSGNFRQN